MTDIERRRNERLEREDREQVLLVHWLRQLSAGRGLLAATDVPFSDAASILKVHDMGEATALIRAGIRLMQVPREQLAVISAFNLLGPEETVDKIDFRRTYVMRELDVSYSTSLRLEQQGLRQLAVILIHLTRSSKETWQERVQLTEGRVFSIDDHYIYLWPHWVSEDLYMVQPQPRIP